MTAQPHQPADAAARVDSDLVARAYRKVMDRQELTKPERAALKRHEREKEERLRWQYYGSIPQKHWRQMSGRQAKVINEQAERYGIPFGGPSINLPAVVRALHDFLADNAHKLAREDDPLMQGSGSSGRSLATLTAGAGGQASKPAAYPNNTPGFSNDSPKIFSESTSSQSSRIAAYT